MKKKLLLFLGIAVTISTLAINHKAIYNAENKLNGLKAVLSSESAVQVKADRTMVPAKLNQVSAKPGVSYKVPQGTLFYGLSNDYYGFNVVYGTASPYTTWNFENTSVGSPVFDWTLKEYDSATKTYIPTTKTLDMTNNNLSLAVNNEEFEFPTLKGTENSLDSTFIFGKNFALKANATGTITAGGASYDNGTRTFNFSNWFRDLGQTTWYFGTNTNDYAFGTGTSGIDAVVAYYEKPQSTLYFEGANFFLGGFSAPAGKTFTLRIITVDVENGFPVMKDTVATSYITTENALIASPTAITLPFTNLLAIDEDGLESELDYIELDDAFVLELSWENANDVSLGVKSSLYDGLGDSALPYYDNHAFFYAPFEDNGGKRTLLQYSWPATLNTSLTNAAYTYLISDVDNINAPATGGSSTLTLIPFYNGAWLDNELPSWITAEETEHYDQGNWGTDFKLTFEALPQGTSSRSADIVFKTWGAKKIVHVSQSVQTDTPSPTESIVKVVKTQSSFEISNAINYNSATLFDISGREIDKYIISDNSTSIPLSSLTNGVYILKLNGLTTQTIKLTK